MWTEEDQRIAAMVEAEIDKVAAAIDRILNILEAHDDMVLCVSHFEKAMMLKLKK